MGIHFTGHGELNNPYYVGHEIANKYKNQGNFIVFEKENGEAQYITQTYLKDLL